MEFRRGRYHRSYGERNSRGAGVSDVMRWNSGEADITEVMGKEIQER